MFKEAEEKWEGHQGEAMSDEHVAPQPIGVRPRRFWLQERQNELRAAIVRYVESGHPVPSEWIDEYNHRAQKKASHHSKRQPAN